MEDLIRSLQELEAISELTEPDDPDFVLKRDAHELVRIIEGLADKLLIGKDGQCEWERIDELGAAGYAVFCGECDRFGWLSGCIQTKKGIVVYG